MLLLTRVCTKDFVALEIQYHRSCYSEYTHKKKLTAAQKVASGVAEQGDKGTIYALAFTSLAEVVEERIIHQHEVISLSGVRLMYERTLMDLDSDIQPGQYRSERLKRCLENHFGDRLEFGKSSHRKIKSGGFLVYASDISRARLKEFYDTRLSQTEDEDDSSAADIDIDWTAPRDSQTDVADAFHTAACLGNVMLDIPSSPWPPGPKDLENSDVV